MNYLYPRARRTNLFRLRCPEPLTGTTELPAASMGKGDLPLDAAVASCISHQGRPTETVAPAGTSVIIQLTGARAASEDILV
jgi:hypothetical protein